uniref:Chemosensory protein 4 n=1 Tax=Sirex noctilio TaxID=36765 RepID=A0A857N901_9HYME|nr:chemosensory protein 4 [Sirex noctilio]
MMWKFVIMLLGTFVLTTAQQQGHDYYTGRWNDINTKDIIDNARLFKKYKECVISNSAVGCPKEALELKRVLPEALETVCAKCSHVQVTKVQDTLSHICKTRKPDFDEILAKIDPEKTFRPRFEEKFGKLNC